MAVANLNGAQLESLTRFLYNVINTTAAQPQPVIAWLERGQNVIRTEWTNCGVMIPDMPLNMISNDLESLTKVLNVWSKRQPTLTRAFHQNMNTFFERNDPVVEPEAEEADVVLIQNLAKTQRICAAYPNNLGVGGAADAWHSIVDMVNEAIQGITFLSKKVESGIEMIAKFDAMKTGLQLTKRNLPKFLIGTESKAKVTESATECIENQDLFWEAYTEWIKMTPVSVLGADGIQFVSRILRAPVVRTDIVFNDQITNVRRLNYRNLICTNEAEHLIPENIAGLSAVYVDIVNTLTKVGSAGESQGAKNDKKAKIIITEVESIVEKVMKATSSDKITTSAARKCLIDEINNIMGKIDMLRLEEVAIDLSHKDRLNLHKTKLLEEQDIAEKEQRKVEALEKTRVQESIKAAPVTKLQKLKGFVNYLSWYRQAKVNLENIQQDTTRCSIVYNSLEDREDRNHLRGCTNFRNMMKYLEQRYNRPSELISSILGKGTNMTRPENDDKQMKANILTVLTIYQDLSDYNMKNKIDSYYINQVIPRVLTRSELQRYTREKMLYDNRNKRKSKRKSKSKHKEESDSDDSESSDDSDSFSDSSVDDRDKFSFVTGSEYKTNDSTSVTDRKFFIRFIKNALHLIRNIESSEAMIKDDDEKKPKKHKHKDDQADIRKTDVDEERKMKCLVDKCSTFHKNKSGKSTQNLQLCEEFKKLSLDGKRTLANKSKICYKCLTPGHKVQDCKSKKSCSKCEGKHHSWLHKDIVKDKDKKAKKDEDANVNKTEGSDETETNSEEEAEVNMARAYELTTAESYFLDKAETKNSNLTCVGEVSMKQHNNSNVSRTLAMFDVCSSHCFILEKQAQKLNLPEVGTFQGLVKTMNGAKRMTLPKYSVKLQKEDGQFVSVIAVGINEIGFKPKIENVRYERLCSAFNIPIKSIDSGHGEVTMLIGVKAQSIQASKVANFTSEKYPEVGVYSSPLLKKYIFVGCAETCDQTDSDDEMDINKISLHEFKNFIDCEEQVVIQDVKCEACSKTGGCRQCKDMKNPVSLKELHEAELMKKDIHVCDVTGEKKRYFKASYTPKEGIDFAKIYDVRLSNEKMARNSSLNLRKKLAKENKLEAFDNQVTESIVLKHMAKVDNELRMKYKGLPISFQLINYVEKETSATTKIRMVTNSSINRINGSLNSNLCIGPNILNGSLDVLNRFSAYPYAILTDLEKAYRSVHTCDTTNSLRRFFWFNDCNDENSIQEFAMSRMTFGDSPASFILAHCEGVISNDVDLSEESRDFIRNSMYVDDGAQSSNSVEKLEKICREIPGMFEKYSFKVKHIIKSYQQKDNIELKTSTETSENILGLIWDFVNDMLLPNLDVHVCKKKRGKYTDVGLTQEMIGDTAITLRVTLRVLAQLYDLSGRHLSPLQIKGRLLYSEVSKKCPEWDKDISSVDQELTEKVRNFLHEILEVKRTLKPLSRAWVQKGYELINLIMSGDGGDKAYSTAAYARSRNKKDNSMFDSRICGARCKISKLSVPDNELCAFLLNMRHLECILESLPEVNSELIATLITDSKCTAYTVNPLLNIKDRRRKNLTVRIDRKIRRIMAAWPALKMIFVWSPTSQIPADLNSKAHSNVAEILNSVKWRKGDKSFYGSQFPSSESQIYMTAENSVVKYEGFPVKQHVADCNLCSCAETDSSGTNQNEDEANVLLTAARSGDMYSEEFYNKLCNKFLNISELVNSLAIIVKAMRRRCVKGYGKCNDSLIKMNIFRKLIRTSQAYFKPKNIRQLYPEEKYGLILTMNRLDSYTHVKYFRNGALPLLGSDDTQLIENLFWHSHVVKDMDGSIHLTKALTLLKMKSGKFGVHLPAMSKIVRRLINNCTECRKQTQISSEAAVGNNYQLKHADMNHGLFSIIQLDIIGHYLVKFGPITRQHRLKKVWALTVVCMMTGAIRFELMENYDTKSFVSALDAQFKETRTARIITADRGSQIVGGKRLLTEDDDATTDNIDTMLKQTEKYFKNSEFVIAPTESQHYNGKVEANIKVAKDLMRSFLKCRKGQPMKFESIFDLSNLLLKVKKILNERPIIQTCDITVSAHDLMFPGIDQDNHEIKKMTDEVDERFKEFCELFMEHVVTGNYLKPGSKTIDDPTVLESNDFVIIHYPSRPGYFKYGIVQAKLSDRRYKIKMLVKRNKSGSGSVGEQIVPIQNLGLLHRP